MTTHQLPRPPRFACSPRLLRVEFATHRAPGAKPCFCSPNGACRAARRLTLCAFRGARIPRRTMRNAVQSERSGGSSDCSRSTQDQRRAARQTGNLASHVVERGCRPASDSLPPGHSASKYKLIAGHSTNLLYASSPLPSISMVPYQQDVASSINPKDSPAI